MLLASCCARRAEAVSSYERHADSVASLRYVSSHGLERIVDTETIIMRQDSTGRLVPVARDIVRRREKTTENASRTDTAVVRTENKENTHSIEKTQPEPRKEANRGTWMLAAGFILFFSAFFIGMALYIKKLWKSRN